MEFREQYSCMSSCPNPELELERWEMVPLGT